MERSVSEYASLESCGVEVGCGFVCAFCASTQQEKSVDFAREAKISCKPGRTYLTSEVAPMAEEWVRSNYM